MHGKKDLKVLGDRYMDQDCSYRTCWKFWRQPKITVRRWFKDQYQLVSKVFTEFLAEMRTMQYTHTQTNHSSSKTGHWLRHHQSNNSFVGKSSTSILDIFMIFFLDIFMILRYIMISKILKCELKHYSIYMLV